MNRRVEIRGKDVEELAWGVLRLGVVRVIVRIGDLFGEFSRVRGIFLVLVYMFRFWFGKYFLFIFSR